jgi:ATP-dependent RNA helicase HelY
MSKREHGNNNQFIEQARRYFLRGISVPKESPFIIDDFQLEAINHVKDGHDTLVVAPTGSGKTYIALSAIEAYLQKGRRAVYTTPLKALSNTKYTELKKRFEPQYKVGLLTGDRKIEGDADVVVATTEIFRNELYRESDRDALVVLDEVHFIADPQRGPVWEESIILAPKTAVFLMLSASISNAEEIAEWLFEVRGKECKIVIKKERPVELRYGFIHPELGVIPLADNRDQVFSEVKKYYGSISLDSSGRRLRVNSGFRGFKGKGRKGPRGKNRGRR